MSEPELTRAYIVKTITHCQRMLTHESAANIDVIGKEFFSGFERGAQS